MPRNEEPSVTYGQEWGLPEIDTLLCFKLRLTGNNSSGKKIQRCPRQIQVSLYLQVKMVILENIFVFSHRIRVTIHLEG